MGGFHTLDGPKTAILSAIDKLKRLGVENVAPGHCTGEEGIRLLAEAYGPHCADIEVGDQDHLRPLGRRTVPLHPFCQFFLTYAGRTGGIGDGGYGLWDCLESLT